MVDLPAPLPPPIQYTCRSNAARSGPPITDPIVARNTVASTILHAPLRLWRSRRSGMRWAARHGCPGDRGVPPRPPRDSTPLRMWWLLLEDAHIIDTGLDKAAGRC